MPKGPARTPRLPSSQAGNKDAPHLKAYLGYLKKKNQQRPVVDPQSRTYKAPLDSMRYYSLVKEYHETISRHAQLIEKVENGIRGYANQLRVQAKTAEERAMIDRTMHQREQQRPYVSYFERGFELAAMVARDFKRTRGLRAFEVGAGYGGTLFFMNKFMGMKTAGIDKNNYGKDFSIPKNLGITYDREADKPIHVQKPFDVTFSIDFMEPEVLTPAQGIRILQNLSRITRMGGKTYHLISTNGFTLFTKKEFEANGFRVDEWKRLSTMGFLVSATRVR